MNNERQILKNQAQILWMLECCLQHVGVDDHANIQDVGNQCFEDTMKLLPIGDRRLFGRL